MNEPERKPVAKLLVNLDDFLVALEIALSTSDEKSKARNLLKLIRLGYGTDRNSRPAQDEVEQVASRLREKMDLLDLCLKLLVTPGRPGSLLQKLRQLIGVQIQKESGILNGPADDQLSESKAAINVLINACVDQDQLSVVFKRCIVATWLARDAKLRSKLFRFIIDKSLTHRSRKFDASASIKPVDPYGVYFDAVLRATGKAKVDFSAFENAVALSSPIRIDVEDFERIASIARDERFIAEEQLRAKALELEIQSKRAQKLEVELRVALEDLEATRAALELEQRKSNEIRSTLTTRHGNELGGQVRRLERSLSLEIEEAIMCLDREEPNVPMALNRIRDLESNLKRFVESVSK
jgi:hypothetical protein